MRKMTTYLHSYGILGRTSIPRHKLTRLGLTTISNNVQYLRVCTYRVSHCDRVLINVSIECRYGYIENGDRIVTQYY